MMHGQKNINKNFKQLVIWTNVTVIAQTIHKLFQIYMNNILSFESRFIYTIQ